MNPYAEAAERLDSILGLNRGVVEFPVAELRIDLSVFSSPLYLAGISDTSLAEKHILRSPGRTSGPRCGLNSGRGGEFSKLPERNPSDKGYR